MEQQHDLLSNDLYVTEISQQYLLASAKWGKFLAIVGFISCGLLIVVGVIISTVLSTSEQFSKLPIPGGLFGAIYIAMSALLFFPCLYLFKFSIKMKDAINNLHQDSFETSLENMKSMFKFYGIFTIVMLGFYALAFVIGSVIAMFSR